MAFVLKDRVREVSTTIGTGALSFSGTSTGYQTFNSALSNGDTTLVCCADSNGNWQTFLGTWDSGAQTMARTTAYEGSAGDGVNVSFSGTAQYAWINYPAAHYQDPVFDTVTVATGGPKISSGSATPEGAVTAGPGSLYLRTAGGAGTSLYIKETGTGTTGWIQSASRATTAFGPSDYIAIGTQTAIPDGIAADTTSNTLNSRMGIVTPTGAAAVDIVLAYPQFSINIPEANMGVAYTVTAAIEYPAGTFTTVLNADGGRYLTVPPGRGFVSFPPCPIRIPAGTRFWIKTFAYWKTTGASFYLSYHGAAWVAGDGTDRGTDLADNTLVAGTPTTTSTYGFGPSVYGRLSSSTVVLGLIGDSIMQTATEAGDPVNNWTFIERAMRGVVPVVNTARNSDSMAIYLERYDGRTAALRNRISHLFMGLGRNDCGVGTIATMKSNYAKIIDPYLARGIKVYGNTITPYTTSTDNWATVGNQTIVTSGSRETIRLEFNTWLRANWSSLGLTALYEWAQAVDPTDSGKWSADGTSGLSAEGYATLSGTTVGSVAMGTYLLSGNSGGSGYPISTTVACTVTNYPGTPGSGAVVVGNTNGSGLVTSYTVSTAGTGYTYPPMVAPNGSWTNDGIHPDMRGYNQIISLCDIRPDTLFY